MTPRVMVVLAPIAVALLAHAAWQVAVTTNALPPKNVPSPAPRPSTVIRPPVASAPRFLAIGPPHPPWSSDQKM